MVDRVDVNSVLMQMRQVKTQLRSQQEAAAAMLEKAAGSTAVPQASAFRNELDNRIRETVGVTESSRPGAAGTDANPFAGDPTVPDFQTMFQNAIGSVNQNQKTAADLASRFEQGDSTIDLPQVMIAMQKSSVSFQAMTQVRNKLVEAYKDIMNMPL
jgi:flagellar hook-basal body complex protein FliE